MGRFKAVRRLISDIARQATPASIRAGGERRARRAREASARRVCKRVAAGGRVYEDVDAGEGVKPRPSEVPHKSASYCP